MLIVSNQTGKPQTVTFETDELGGDKPGLKQSTSPIEPRGTATLQVDVREGNYAVSVAARGIRDPPPSRSAASASRPRTSCWSRERRRAA